MASMCEVLFQNGKVKREGHFLMYNCYQERMTVDCLRKVTFIGI